MIIGDLIDQAVRILKDVAMVTWERDQLIQYMNSGIKMVCNYRPDASTVIDSVSLVNGTKQQLPAGAMRLHDVLHNGNSAAPGAALRLVDRKTKDAMDPLWHTEEASTTIYEVVSDEKFPGIFWVSPPAAVGDGVLYITLGWSTIPEDLDPMGHTDQEFPLIAKYAPAVLEWMLYQCFSQDSERTTNAARSLDHRNAFYHMLGIKTQADGAYAPNARGSS